MRVILCTESHLDEFKNESGSREERVRNRVHSWVGVEREVLGEWKLEWALERRGDEQHSAEQGRAFEEKTRGTREAIR